MTIDSSQKRCSQCGTGEQLECHEVWDYPTVTGADGAVRHVMKLVGLQALCHLCHIGKHIGFAHTNRRLYKQVKDHLQRLYQVSHEEFAARERHAIEYVAELNRAGPRALDLTFLNDERFVWVQHRFGRNFTEDETDSCRDLDKATDVDGVT